MTDPREIEGSPERAADRGRADDLGFSMSSKPNLGNADVIAGLLSEFGSAAVSIRKRYNEGKIDGDQAKSELRELAVEYGNIVMGRDDKYEALPWNSPDSLGRRIKLVVPAINGVGDPGELLFLTIGTSLMSIAAAHEENRLTDDAGEKHTQDMLQDTAALLLGLR